MADYVGARTGAILSTVRAHAADAAAGEGGRHYHEREQQLASDAHRWLHQKWRESRERYRAESRREVASNPELPPGLEHAAFPASWLAKVELTCVEEWSEPGAIALEAALQEALHDLAVQSGTHVAVFSAVAPAPQSRRLHAHALLTVDPAEESRRGVAAVLQPGAEYGSYAPGELWAHAEARVHEITRRALIARGIKPCEGEPRVRRYLTNADWFAWLRGEAAPTDHAGELYLAKHYRPHDGGASRCVLAAACPARAGRLRRCTQDHEDCTYGFPKRPPRIAR